MIYNRSDLWQQEKSILTALPVDRADLLQQERNHETAPVPIFALKKDDAIEASVKTDQANVDFSVTVQEKYTPKEAWRILTQVITDYFDAIELSDQETSYLRTAWTVHTFQQNTIRTRVIVKLGDTSLYKIKVKLLSESSDERGTSPKSDEKFREWDRCSVIKQSVALKFTVTR